MAADLAPKRLVVKIGSALLVDPATGLRRDWLASLAADVAALSHRGCDVVLVSSGSIALGRMVLGLPSGELPLEQAQAAAAVGQIQLARAYEEALAPHGKTAAQVLVTLEDSSNRRRYLNSRATLSTLLNLGAIPIVNENDTVATDEIRFGDNDRLAAQVAVTIGADQLVLLSDVDGLYTGNPNLDADAQHIPHVPTISPQIEAMAGDPTSGMSKGGMKTKIMAAQVASEAGCAMAITLGSHHNPLDRLYKGGKSTWFSAQTDPQTARKRWIASMKPAGTFVIDQGAADALGRGNSLLPAGVTTIEGQFGRGDPVVICDANGQKLGQGLTRYTRHEAAQIIGRKTIDIAEILGYEGRAALVHRDDLVM